MRRTIRRAAQSLRRTVARTLKGLSRRSNGQRVFEEPLGSGRRSPAAGESARRRLHRRGARLPSWLATNNEGELRVELLFPGTEGLTVGMGRRGSGRDTRRGPAERIEALPTEAVTSIDAKYLLMSKTNEPARGGLLSWRAYLGSLSVGTAVRPADDGWGLFSGFIVSALLGAALLLLLSLLRLARAQWTHHSARAHWAVEGAAAARLQSRARTRGARLRLRAARAAAVVLQREARRRLARRGLLAAAAAGAEMDARTCIRALLLHDRAPKGGSIVGDRALKGCRVPGEESWPHAALAQPTRVSAPKVPEVPTKVPTKVPKVPRVHELQALQGVQVTLALGLALALALTPTLTPTLSLALT